MSNPKPNTKGLRPNPHTLGVEKLAEGEESWTIRIRAKSRVREQLKGKKPKEIGELLEWVMQERPPNPLLNKLSKSGEG